MGIKRKMINFLCKVDFIQPQFLDLHLNIL